MTIIEKIIQDAQTVPKTIMYKLTHKCPISQTDRKNALENAYTAYLLLKNIDFLDLDQCQNVILSSKDYMTIYYFALLMKNKEITQLCEKVIFNDTSKENCNEIIAGWAFYFARDVVGSDIKTCSELVAPYKTWRERFFKEVKPITFPEETIQNSLWGFFPKTRD